MLIPTSVVKYRTDVTAYLETDRLLLFVIVIGGQTLQNMK